MRKNFKNYSIIFGFVGAFILCLAFASKVVTYEPPDRKDMDSMKVSVVVPVYNTEKYVGEFLDSLENQTLKEIEIVCVNDGSTDNTLQILKNHQQKDSRIKIIEQKNAGVAAARNQGIRNAQGTYMVFADSDDIIPPYAYEKAYKDAIKYKVDVVALNMMTFKDGESINPNDFKYDESKVKKCGRRSYQNPFYYMLQNSGYIVNKFFKRSFIANNNLFFKEGITHYEDGLFNFMAFPLLYEMVQDDNIFYCARLNRPNSAVYSFNAKKVLSSSLKVAQELIDHHDLFNFRKADEWILDKIMDINYLHITRDTKESELKKYYAGKLVELLEENYFKKYDIKISQGIHDKVSELKTIAAG